ncbi:aldose 1-epimerase family protein [Glaciihabitans sp. UYNi722]|uniref:aldose 1-epimerase family protein n=1 Tax=Glaciihabitans sp. UYNi722 TaxID=3156344 RepID=UPI003394AB54
MTDLSGRQYRLESGSYRATVASVGASLRELTFDGRRLVVPFNAAEVRPAFRGATLAPWPNRVVDGTYSFDGTDYQLSLTEPSRHHALHGLAGWLDFSALEESADRLVLGATVEAQVGYPFRLELRIEFRLDDGGLHWSVSALNTGALAAPFGTGPHPYLVAGDGHVDDWALELPASSVLTVTADRLIPLDLDTVEGGEFDFRSSRTIADTFIDHAFTDITRNENGLASVRVLSMAGTGVGMSWGTDCPWVQVHTADRPAPEPSRIGLAVEPMTCPPDAFNSGTDLLVIQPGESASAGWSIHAI